MNTQSLFTMRSLAIVAVLVCAPFTQACSEDKQAATELGA